VAGAVAFDGYSATGGDTHIWVVDDKGFSQPRRLTVGVNVHCTDPTWSPDGRHIAFVRQASPAFDRELWVMRADGTKPQPLFGRGAGPSWSSGPAWAPDGTKIAYNNGNTYSVAVVNTDGTNARDIALNGSGAAWSPDGTRIAFRELLPFPLPVADRNGLAVMNADGSGRTHLVELPAPMMSDALAWSPDGTKIALSEVISGVQDVFVMNENGIGLKNLTRRFTGPLSVGRDSSPAWSPDGTKLAFASDRGSALGLTGIWTINADGTGARWISKALQGHVCSNPAWWGA
jgi:TolB protein